MNRSTTSGLFTDSEFVKIWTVGLLTGVVRWLELLAFGIYGYDVTGSAALVALLVVLRFLPLALFGVFLGALSDLFSPRKLMIGGLVIVMATSAVMLALFWTGRAVLRALSTGLAGHPSNGPSGVAARAIDTVWPRSVPPSAIIRYHHSPIR